MWQPDMARRDCEHSGLALQKINVNVHGNKTCCDLKEERLWTYCECGLRPSLQISQVTRHHNLCLVSVNG